MRLTPSGQIWDDIENKLRERGPKVRDACLDETELWRPLKGEEKKVVSCVPLFEFDGVDTVPITRLF